MIYAGFIHVNGAQDKTHELTIALRSLIHTPPTIVRKKSITLCYGKLSNGQDMDEILENESSFLMGRIFDKANHCSFSKKDFRNLSLLNTEQVLEKIWGKYVYINVNQNNSQFEIVVDATGQLPFFYYPFPDGNLLFASDMEILFKVLSEKPQYNWSYLCSYFIYGNSCAIQTPFEKVYELPPACSLKITKNGRETAPFWNPLCSYKNQEMQGEDAVTILQNTLKPWIKPYKNICVSLSGGLDSSALVYCLKDMIQEGQTLTALNYFHSQVHTSNELVHARKVCQEAGIELIEMDASSSLPFDLPHTKQPLNPNKPFPGLVSLRWTESVFEKMPSNGPFAFLSGHGSDHIFMRPPSKRSVSDYVLEKGLKGSMAELKNVAQFYRDPLFSVLKENAVSLGSHFFGLRKKKKRNLKSALGETPDWIKQEVYQTSSSDFIHPIYDHLPKKILPGKYNQIDAVYEGLASIHVEMMNQVDPTYYPFLYKPVVEFALSFPTYKLFNKGYDRYPLRQSVSDSFKTETVWRRDKSQTTGIFQLGIKKNLAHVLEICLEGHFVKQGFVDRESLRKTIMLIGNGDIKNMWPFVYLISVEIFLRYWDEVTL